ncbi:kinase-like domain-containing protein [Mucor mucedo]|uniref:kinase-like domain-containing protein n=1 Tax=Mucor mucedo TaxID=29922 RepID=UPI00221FBF9E|nr:kinase-like domain-containing protein [Mucor mucedo]KAI7869256.1 kinase-like domain-containing protein [Mucor mucedo]
MTLPAPYTIPETFTKVKHSKVRTRSSGSKEITFDELPTFEESTNAWGFLYKVGGQVFTLSRNMDQPDSSVIPGYVIGTNDQCDIKYNIECYIYINILTYIAENPSYDFVKPRRKGKKFSSFDELYHKSKKLGTGSFGIVSLAICKTTGKRVAIKQVQLSGHIDALETKKRIGLLREISIFMALPPHPCIIRVDKVFEEDSRMFIVMEYGSSGDLFTNIYSLFMTELEIKIIFEQIAHAVLYLHSKGIVHRDIKMENVIVCDRERLYVKLTDFGLCAFLKKDEALYTNCGTMLYAAPELLNSNSKKGYGMEVDIWSLGVLLYGALTNSMPFVNMVNGEDDEKKQLRELIGKGQFSFDHPAWDGISEEAKDLVCQMMQVDVNKRYTIKQVLLHPWLQDIENEQTKEMGVTRNPALLQYLDNKPVSALF